MKALLLTLLLFYSCKQSATLTKGSVGLQISPVTMGISHLNEIVWNIGPKKEAQISQSFNFIVDMPKIDQDDLEYMIKERGVDSWIVRMIVLRNSQTQDLGSLYTMFKPRRIARGNESSGAPTSVSIKVFYAAAYASERFRSLSCPTFGHNKRISSMEIKGSDDEFSLSVDQKNPYGEKSHQVELTPTSFNGGNSLVGEYFLEIAPYNSLTRTIYSTFKRIPMSIIVNQEENVSVPGCEGVHEEFQ